MPVRLPAAGGDIWAAFSGLSRRRTYHASGPNPITWEAIEAFCRLKRVPLEPHHVDLVIALDDVWLEHAARKAPPSGAKTAPLVSAGALTPELFDLSIR